MDKPEDIKSFKRAQPPSPLEDPFPQKRQSVTRLDDKFDSEAIKHILQRVVQCLMAKSLHEGRKSDKFNQTYLGGVSFYIDYNDITHQTRLQFDKHPTTWKEDDIVRDALNIEADIMMDKQAQEDIIDNPFMY